MLELSPWLPRGMPRERRSADQYVLAARHNADPCRAAADHSGGPCEVAADPAAALICQCAELTGPLLDQVCLLLVEGRPHGLKVLKCLALHGQHPTQVHLLL